MFRQLKYGLITLFALLQQVSFAGGFDGGVKVGTGKIVITPELPFHLTGYAGRDTPAVDKVHDLWAKALVIEESPSSRIVIVTTDVLGLTPAISDAARPPGAEAWHKTFADHVQFLAHPFRPDDLAGVKCDRGL
ncbi:hypothetical protein [Chitinophaga sp. XS-30]|uniref:hypothetical protein n=1 Tax=Chitinophaga sp. XS-30 TaxID=2604421 RepID=UPI0011DD1F85|nr:hypothetical protein [Chitinophaga sp. XS-30]QEH41835.1 hypothetical protein FW415_13485 [Chitinophaga sp. XS-30]